MKIILFFLLLIPNFVFSASLSEIGEKGYSFEVDRIIYIYMYDNYFKPNQISVSKGETIKFIIKNLGKLVHEFNIGTKDMHKKHEIEMLKMVENEILLGDKIDHAKMKEIAKIDHSMSHSHSNSILLEPNMIGEIIWKFNAKIDLEAACNIPGHYDSGMISKINKL